MKNSKKRKAQIVGDCPTCQKEILADYSYTWCTDCSERLPDEMQKKLPRLDPIRAGLALAENPVLLNTLTDAEKRSIPTQRIVSELRQRASLLRLLAGGIMVGITLFALIGIGIFLGAGTTAQREILPSSYRALEEVADIRDQLRGLETSLKAEFNRRNAQPQGAETADRAGNRSASQKREEPLLTPEQISSSLTSLNAFNETVNKRIDDLIQTRVVDSQAVVPILLSTVGQRVCIVVLLIFLLQILVPTYRYNIKLAAYYSARADALELLARVPDHTLDKLIPILSPDSLDFGRTVQSPTEHLIELVKEAARLGRSTAGTK